MRIGFIFLLEIKLARFADSRLVLLHEVWYTAHAHLDGLATIRAFHLSIDDKEIVIGALNTSKYQ